MRVFAKQLEHSLVWPVRWFMKNYLVVGASSGIGRSLSESLVSDEVCVYGTYFQHKREEENNLKYHFLDVLDESIQLDFLPDTLDGLAYCPGAINLKPFNRIKSSELIEDFKLQTVGAVKVIQAVLPYLKKSSSASIVLFSTVAVGTGYPYHSIVASSKGAIEGLCRSLAAEFSPHIRVNCIAPSLTDTPLAARLLNSPEKVEANANKHPLRRVGKAGDMADKSSWTTGQIFKIDGGISSIKN